MHGSVSKELHSLTCALWAKIKNRRVHGTSAVRSGLDQAVCEGMLHLMLSMACSCHAASWWACACMQPTYTALREHGHAGGCLAFV